MWKCCCEIWGSCSLCLTCVESPLLACCGGPRKTLLSKGHSRNDSSAFSYGSVLGEAPGAATGAGCRYLCALGQALCIPRDGERLAAACGMPAHWDGHSPCGIWWHTGGGCPVQSSPSSICALLRQSSLLAQPGQVQARGRCLNVLPAHGRLLHTTAWQCLPPSQLPGKGLTGPSSVPVTQLVPSVLSLLPPLP